MVLLRKYSTGEFHSQTPEWKYKKFTYMQTWNGDIQFDFSVARLLISKFYIRKSKTSIQSYSDGFLLGFGSPEM